MTFFIARAADDPFFVFSWILIITFSICVHEFAHAWSALKLGDDTAASNGHLSLNPLVQMGGSSLILLLLFGIAWGAVPVDPSRLRTAGRAGLVAAAGPAANLLLALLFSALTVVAAIVPALADGIAADFFRLAAVANGVLALFNLLPIPMFDGWTVFSVVFPALRRIDVVQAQPIAWLALVAVWVTPVGDAIWSAGGRLALHMIQGWATLASL